MTDERKRSCSGMEAIGAAFDDEFRAILDALFCACLPESQTRETRLRREVYLRCQIEGRPLAEIAHALDLDPREAEDILEKIRRDIAVLRMLGLGAAGGAQTTADSPSAGCRCGGGAGAQDAIRKQSRHRENAHPHHSGGPTDHIQ